MSHSCVLPVNIEIAQCCSVAFVQKNQQFGAWTNGEHFWEKSAYLVTCCESSETTTAIILLPATADCVVSHPAGSSMGVPNKLLTLVMIHQDSRILLGMKKRGFGVGRFNGFGGKVEKGETIEEGAKRELLEECCVTAKSLDHIGRIDFEFVGEPQILEVHIFKTDRFEGEPTETEEMKPEWFSTDSIPYDKMWPDDRMWVPMLLKGIKFKGYMLFEGMDTILKVDLKELDPGATIDSS